jgi:hypothetical protein
MIAEMGMGEGGKVSVGGVRAGPAEIPRNCYAPGGDKRIMTLGEYRSTV